MTQLATELLTATSTRRCTSVTRRAALFRTLESNSVAVIVAVLVSWLLSKSVELNGTDMVISLPRPAFRLNAVHETVPPAAVQPALADPNVVNDGNTSVTSTPDAFDGPEFNTLSV